MKASIIKLYSSYAKQINRLLANKSEMWGIGFRNGLLSAERKEPRKPQNHLAMDYDIGYMEGYSYALYKSSFHDEKNEFALIKEENKSPNIIVGFIVQDYDFNENYLWKTSLGLRQLDINALCRVRSGQDNNSMYDCLNNEKDKLQSIINYLKQTDL